AAAIDERPTLFQEAFERKVLLATPTTLLAILKSISFTWQQDSTIRHAEDIALLSKELYTNLRTMVDRFDDLGRSLTKSVDAYNVSIGALQRKVLPKAQKLSELDIPGTADPLPLLKQVDSVTRHSS
ncbi:MAG: DNA recombination protein RmuC, partial [Pseudomonadota bacterium]